MASLVKTVEMRILANAGDAQAKLDELDAKAKDLDGNAIKMRFKIDTEEGRAQLDAIQARTKALGFDEVKIKVRVDGKGRAIADLEALKHEADSAGGGGGLLGGLMSGLSGAGSALPLVGGLGPAAIPALVGGLAALLPEVVAVGSGFAAAGAGAGAFALLALPAIEQVKTALSDTPAQMKKLNLSPDESGAVAGIRKLETEFKKLSNAFQPQAFRVFNEALKVAGNLLPQLAPFARTFATALSGLLQQANKFTQSSGFTNWLKQFQSLIGPAVTAIGQGVGNVANAFGKLLTTFSGKDVSTGIRIAFGAISGAITGIRGAINLLKTAWDGISQNPAIKRIAADFKTAWDSISQTGKKKPDFSALTAAVKDAANTAITWLSQRLGPLVNGALKTASSWLSKNANTVLKPAGVAIMTGLIDGMKSQLPSLLGFLGKVAATIAEHKGPIEADRVLLVPHGKAIMDGLINGIKARTAALKAQLQDTAKMIKAEIQLSVQVAQNEISSNSIMNAASTAQGGPLAPVATSDLISGMQQQVAQVKAFTAAIRQLKAEGLNATTLSQIIGAGSAGGLPTAQALLSGGKGAVAQINSLQKQLKSNAAQLGNAAAGPMYQAGQEAAQGLAKGLKSQLGEVNKAMKQLADSMVQAIKKALNSHSPSLVMADIGMTIPQGVAVGIDRAAHLAIGASSRLAASTVQPWSGAGGHGGGGGITVNFNGIVGDKYGTAQELHQVLRDYKRNRGNAPLGLG